LTDKPTFQIRRVTPQEKDRFIATVVHCFIDDHFFRAMYPSNDQYTSEMAKFIELDARTAIKQGTAWIIGDFLGVGYWIKPGTQFDDHEFYELVKTGCHSDYQSTALKLFEVLEEFIPIEPHWYLSFFGILQEHRDKGLGSLLLKHTLEMIDACSQMAYLETFDVRNVPFYQRLGFEQFGMRVIDANLTVIIMNRPAR
jgi:GNAT superfamily N-acetyltransferase